MKFKLLLLSCLLIQLGGRLKAQAPQLINFEGVARDNNGNTLKNTLLGLRFSILDSIDSASVVYVERDTLRTNGFGLFSALIGGGTPITGTFSQIKWYTGLKYLMVELDPNGGSNYINMGSTQLVSAPYALYADSVGKNSYPSHHVGDHYGGGIVFWTDSLGQHGLIADTVDLDTGIVWNNGSYFVSNATRNGIGAGKFNTERVIFRQGTGQYATQLCADYQGGGYSDWYLPSATELTTLYQQQAVVGGFTTGTYWSSSELSSHQATAISFTGGAFTPSDKAVTNAVRAIRTF